MLLFIKNKNTRLNKKTSIKWIKTSIKWIKTSIKWIKTSINSSQTPKLWSPNDLYSLLQLLQL